MNDKVVSSEVKISLAILMLAFEAFGDIVNEHIQTMPEPSSDKVARFEIILSEFGNAMMTFINTVKANQPTDLTVNGCLAILLDMGKVVDIHHRVSVILDFESDIADDYGNMTDALQNTAQIVMMEA